MKIVGHSNLIPNLIRDLAFTAIPNDVTLIEVGSPLPADCDRRKCIWIGDNVSPEAVIGLNVDSGVGHVVNVNGVNVRSELSAAIRMIYETEQFFRDPVKCILGTPPTQPPLQLAFTAAVEKAPTIDAIRNFVTTIPFSKSVVDDIVVVADELFTNAVFNAPHHKGQEMVDSLLRAPSVSLQKGKTGRFLIGNSDDCIVLTCEDPFGTLNPQAVAARIQRCFREGVSASINMGIGTYMVYTLAVSLYIIVNCGVCSQVSCVFPLKKSLRSISALSRNIHIAVIGGSNGIP